MNAQGEGVASSKILGVEAYRAKLIPSRVLQLCPYIGSTRKFISYNYRDVFGSLIKLNWHFPVSHTVVFIEFSCLSDHQANGPS